MERPNVLVSAFGKSWKSGDHMYIHVNVNEAVKVTKQNTFVHSSRFGICQTNDLGVDVPSFQKNEGHSMENNDQNQNQRSWLGWVG